MWHDDVQTDLSLLETAVCSECGVSRPLSEFLTYTHTLRSYCLLCAKDPRRSLPLNPEQHKIHQRCRKYNLSLAEYELMFDLQRGRCAICQRHPRKMLVIDHDHTTGRVRGLLCGACNQGLGMFNDNPTFITAAANYLRRYSE
jgi:hypothetical protein